MRCVRRKAALERSFSRRIPHSAVIPIKFALACEALRIIGLEKSLLFSGGWLRTVHACSVLNSQLFSFQQGILKNRTCMCGLFTRWALPGGDDILAVATVKIGVLFFNII